MTRRNKMALSSTTTSSSSNRQFINCFSFLITCAILFVAVKVSDGGGLSGDISFATRINKISENLDQALSAVMIQGQPNYTNITDNATYISKIDFNPRGMAGLYNFTNAFMDLVLPRDIYPEGFLKVDDGRIEFGNLSEQWQGLLSKYAGLLAMIIIIILFILFMPFCGLCFCCCRCCGKCGARSQPCDKKHDLCKKIVLATLLIALGTLMLFGVVCAFASNQQMEEGINGLTKNLRSNIKDTNTYLNTTNGQVKILLNTNYGEFETVLINTIQDSNTIVYDGLKNYSNATSMLELAAIVEKLPKIRGDFDTLKYSTNSLRVYASQLNDAVRKVRKDLLAALVNCNLPKCLDINKNISSLQTNIHFNSLPDISEQIDTLESLPLNEFKDAVIKGIENLDEIKIKIGETVNKTLTDALNHIQDAGKEIKKGSAQVTNAIDDLQKNIDKFSLPALDTADDYMKQYSHYRYYVSLAVSCTLLLISLCIVLGLICGICGKRPDVFGDDCCNKGAGSQFLICGVMLMFLAGFLFAIVTLAMFVVGIVTQRVACDSIKDPAHSQMFKLFDKGVMLGNDDGQINVTLSQALINCYNNESIYNVFNLKNKFNLNEVSGYLDKFNISTILDSLDMGSIVFKDFHILDDNDKNLLNELADSDFANINFDNFKDLLEDSFTTVNLTDLSNELSDLIKQIENSGQAVDILSDLKLSKLHLETYQERIVEPMIKNATDVVKLAMDLDNDLALGHSSFQAAILDMLNELVSAEETLKSNGTESLKNIARNFTDGIILVVQDYLDRIVTHVEHDIGKCGPLSATIKSTLSATCDQILLPWNGFWFGVFWSLILFVPTIIVSVKLATLYQKYSPYSGHLVETEYLYDAYADRDNIPLSGRHSKMNKKKSKKYKRYEEQRSVSNAAGSVGGGGVGGVGDVVTREYPSGSHQDTRYADMAPKQWEEFPPATGEGPPQYQRAPTEYERPPPYYYPGAGDNQ